MGGLASVLAGLVDEARILVRSPYLVLWVLTPLAAVVVVYYALRTVRLEEASRSFNPARDFEHLGASCVTLSAAVRAHTSKDGGSYLDVHHVVGDLNADALAPVASWRFQEKCGDERCQHGGSRHRVGERFECWRAAPQAKLDRLFRHYFRCGSGANNPACYLRSDPTASSFGVDTGVYASALGVLALLGLMCAYTCCTQQREELNDARRALRAASVTSGDAAPAADVAQCAGATASPARGQSSPRTPLGLQRLPSTPSLIRQASFTQAKVPLL
ncbi:hypothetical protein KFE25_003483 [Diacronema lutheri]|uniref:Uncharacterized protein n=1 Tax=Diacronema lutheri TaxID=2081491 RepID=A0A8J6CC57_DIALT|nr:hypothetical protein KFE25_003483 [Diacronema lutheri]